MDLNTLYRTVIMDNYKNPKNKGLTKSDEFHFVHLNNPSCGDEMNVEIKVHNGIIEDIKQDGHGCSISMSSASVASDLLKGLSLDEALRLCNVFFELVQGVDPENEDELGEAIAYTGVRQFPARIKCATLAWKAIEKAIEEVKNNVK